MAETPDEQTTQDQEQKSQSGTSEATFQKPFEDMTEEEQQAQYSYDGDDAAKVPRAKAEDIEDEEEEEEKPAAKGKTDDTSEEDDEEKTSAGEAGKPPADWLSPDLIARSISVGMSPQDAQAIGDPMKLTQVVGLLEQQKAAQGGEKTGDAESRQVKTSQLAELKKKLETDSDYFDPEVAEIMKGLVGEIETLHESMNEGQARENDTAVEWFDEQIGQLGSEADKLLGKGSSRGFSAGTVPYQNRGALWERIRLLQSSANQLGQRMSKRDAFRQAVTGLFGEQIPLGKDRQISKKLEKRKGGFSQRGGSRKGKDPRTSIQKAGDFAEAYLAKKGVAVPQQDEDEIF